MIFFLRIPYCSGSGVLEKVSFWLFIFLFLYYFCLFIWLFILQGFFFASVLNKVVAKEGKEILSFRGNLEHIVAKR